MLLQIQHERLCTGKGPSPAPAGVCQFGYEGDPNVLSFNLILIPTDFSEQSLTALDYAIGLAERFSSDLWLVHVHEPLPRISDMAWEGVDVTERDRDALDRVKKSLQKIARERVPKGVRIDTEAINGQTVREIIKCAQREGADLIVMATHGRTGLKHVLMGSTTEAVIRRAPCPVLALKQPMTVSTG